VTLNRAPTQLSISFHGPALKESAQLRHNAQQLIACNSAKAHKHKHKLTLKTRVEVISSLHQTARLVLTTTIS
jgi:hypothetical protein